MLTNCVFVVVVVVVVLRMIVVVMIAGIGFCSDWTLFVCWLYKNSKCTKQVNRASAVSGFTAEAKLLQMFVVSSFHDLRAQQIITNPFSGKTPEVNLSILFRQFV